MVVPVNGDGVMVVVKAMLLCAAAMYLLAVVVRSLGADPTAIISSKVSAILIVEGVDLGHRRVATSNFSGHVRTGWAGQCVMIGMGGTSEGRRHHSHGGGRGAEF